MHVDEAAALHLVEQPVHEFRKRWELCVGRTGSQRRLLDKIQCIRCMRCVYLILLLQQYRVYAVGYSRNAYLLAVVAHNAASQLIVEGVGQGEHHLVPIGTQQPLEGIACDDKGHRVVLCLTQLSPEIERV